MHQKKANAKTSNEKWKILHCSICIMSTRATRESHSANFFNLERKQGGEENQH